MTPEGESYTILFAVTSSHIFCGTYVDPSELHMSHRKCDYLSHFLWDICKPLRVTWKGLLQVSLLWSGLQKNKSRMENISSQITENYSESNLIVVF